MSIGKLLEQRSGKSSELFGVVAGVVTNIEDPDGLGRIKVKIPRISGDDESNWARVLTFMAGKERGAFFLPEIDDEVLLAFEYGDISMPYVIGSLWNGVDVPPETNSDGKNNIRLIKSRSGHQIKIDDTDGEEKIEIIDKSDKNKIVIDTKNNTVTIEADKDIKISAPNGKFTVEAKDIEMKASAAAKIEASADIDVKASGNMNLKGSTVNIN